MSRRRLPWATVLFTLLALTLFPAAASAAGSGANVRTVTVVLVVGAGATAPDDGAVRDVVDRAGATWSFLSNGRIRFRLDRIERRIVPSYSCSLRAASDAARAVRFQPSERAHLVAVLVGRSCTSGGEAFMPGKLSWVLWQDQPEEAARVLAHELGHNLGLGHTATERCGEFLAALCGRAELGRGAVDEYGGDDLLGGGGRFLNPVMLRQLGLLPQKSVRTITLTGDRPSRVELWSAAGSSGVRAVRLLHQDAGGHGREWWISYDDSLNPPKLRVHVARDRHHIVQQLPDPERRDSAPLAGETYRLPRGLLTVRSIGASAVLEIDPRPAVKLTGETRSGNVVVGVDTAALRGPGNWLVELRTTGTGSHAEVRGPVVAVSAANPVATFNVDTGGTYRAVLLRDRGDGARVAGVTGLLRLAGQRGATGLPVSSEILAGEVRVTWNGTDGERVEVRRCREMAGAIEHTWTNAVSGTTTLSTAGAYGAIEAQVTERSGRTYTVAIHQWGGGCSQRSH